MSLQPGQIIGQDLSPNANILGTQIADKTLQFRNFSEDTFKIVKTGTATVPSSTFAYNSSSGYSGAQIAHNLGFVPLAQVFAFIGTGVYALSGGTVIYSYVPLPIYNDLLRILNNGDGFPYTWIDSATGNAGLQAANLYFAIDSSNIYITAYFVGGGSSGNVTTRAIPIKYYLLQETAN